MIAPGSEADRLPLLRGRAARRHDRPRWRAFTYAYCQGVGVVVSRAGNPCRSGKPAGLGAVFGSRNVRFEFSEGKPAKPMDG